MFLRNKLFILKYFRENTNNFQYDENIYEIFIR